MCNMAGTPTIWKIYKLAFLISVLASLPHIDAGITCYNCTDPHDDGCYQIDECNDTEVCYRERLVTEDGTTMYKSGCISKQICGDSLRSGLIFGKRSSITKCSQCCEVANCNMALCDNSIGVDICSNSPCLHGGTCQQQGGSYLCVCPNGYKGTNCELVGVDICSNSPCLHGGTCQQQGGSYLCVCPNGYKGTNCELAEKPTCIGQQYFTWNNHCYYISSEIQEWKMHKSVNTDPCKVRNMKIAVIDTNSEHYAMLHQIREVLHEKRTFWLGGRYTVSNHTWNWINGDVINPHSSHWEGTSGGRHTHPYCMVMNGRMWDNRNCNDPHIHLCESGEFQVNLRPLITSGNCTGSNFFQYDGHCYYFLNDIKRRHDHEPCKAIGDDFSLTIINNDAEQMAVSHFIRDIMNYTDVVWLRGYFAHYYGHEFWGWSHTEKIDLHSSNWKDNPYQNHGCLVLDGHQWGIRKCQELHYQLCEGGL